MDFEKLNDIENIDTIDEYEQLEDWLVNTDIRYDVPDVDCAVVTGNPEKVAEKLDFVQGDEVYGAGGTCGLTSIANLCVLNGQEVTEGMVVEYALKNNLCYYDPWSPADTGGTTAEQQVELLGRFGLEARFQEADIHNYDVIANAIDDGRGVIIELDAGTLWDEPSCKQTMFGIPVANHAVTLTGVARDAQSGEIAGFYICDSGRGIESDACRYVPIEKFSEAYNANVLNAGAVITNQPIRSENMV